MTNGPIMPVCAWHRPMNKKLGYVEHSDWMARKVRQGHRQHRCRVCGRLYFKCEWGARPWPKTNSKKSR